MEVKDIIEKIDCEIKSTLVEKSSITYSYFNGKRIALLNLKQWIESNLEEEQAKYGKDRNDYQDVRDLEEQERIQAEGEAETDAQAKYEYKEEMRQTEERENQG